MSDTERTPEVTPLPEQPAWQPSAAAQQPAPESSGQPPAAEPSWQPSWQQPWQQQPVPPQPEPAQPTPSQPAERPRPLTGTIIWGSLILAFCGFVAQRVLAPGTVQPTVWITAVVLFLGVTLVGAGIAAIVRQSRGGAHQPGRN